MRTFGGGARLQFHLMRADPNYWLPFLIVPFTAVVFLAIVRNADRDDLLADAMLAASFMGMWTTAVHIGGEIVEMDRFHQIMEPTVASGSLAWTLLGRTTTVALTGTITFVECWLVSLIVFRTAIPVRHPLVLVATLVLTVVATAASSLIIGSVFVLARSARTFQNALTYPLYVVGGIFVPVERLPAWVEPLSWLVYLSWSSELMRAAVNANAPSGAGLKLFALAALAFLSLIIGLVLLDRIVDRLRTHGRLALA
jgi:ABC-2 type transport system permease protein